MTPAGRLLLDLLSAVGARAPEFPPPFPAGVNWEDLHARVKRHRLGPLFSRKLPGTLPIPNWIREEWEEEYQRQLARAVLSGDCLREVLNLFARRGIETIVLKGGHLAETHYPHPALRPADDLDLLIRPGDGREAAKLLVKSGFLIQEKTTTAEKYLSPATGIFLELHTNLQTPQRRNPAFAIRIEDFRDESTPARITGQETRVLSPEINLLYLAAHLSHHSFSRLIWFYDLFLLIKQSPREIDWEKLSRRAGEYCCSGQVYYPLLFTGVFFGRTAPPEALNRLSPHPIKRMITRLFINPAAILEEKIPAAGLRAQRNRFLLNDSWPLALKTIF
ncbi:MAG: nucleotidyltransferase family protein [Candidatus Erginobacter occultus]|nr:nucleotidyltransferase family protein [Candidatus Erginobacter occultus]